VALPNSNVISYQVDGMGRTVARSVNGSLQNVWLYRDALNPVAEYDGQGNLVSRFVYGTKGHVPDYLVRNGVTYRVVTDQLGSVRLVVNAATGSVVQRIDYDSFGNILSDSNPGFQPFGFAGGLYDNATKLTRFGARDYDAFTGRWTAKDPIGFAGGLTNLYGYVGNDPVNHIDPSGNFAIVAVWVAGAGITLTEGLVIDGVIGSAFVVGDVLSWEKLTAWVSLGNIKDIRFIGKTDDWIADQLKTTNDPKYKRRFEKEQKAQG
jgi:RHS repeat-associated protein